MDLYEKIEAARERAYANAGLDDELDFHTAAAELGFTVAECDDITINLNYRTMRARGGI